MTAASRLKDKIEQALALLVMAFIIRYIIAPTKTDKVMIWLYILMPIITMIVLVILGVKP